MQVVNEVLPQEAQATRFFSTPDDGPMVMLNLLKFREKAAYPDGSNAHMSGAEAYAIYAAGVTKLLESMGGRITFAGTITGILLGQVEELWDMVALAEYPSTSVMLKMATSPEYAAIAHHRIAGLAGQLDIRVKSLAPAR